jgi:hypothetical protein
MNDLREAWRLPRLAGRRVSMNIRVTIEAMPLRVVCTYAAAAQNKPTGLGFFKCFFVRHSVQDGHQSR